MRLSLSEAKKLVKEVFQEFPDGVSEDGLNRLKNRQLLLRIKKHLKLDYDRNTISIRVHGHKGDKLKKIIWPSQVEQSLDATMRSLVDMDDVTRFQRSGSWGPELVNKLVLPKWRSEYFDCGKDTPAGSILDKFATAVNKWVERTLTNEVNNLTTALDKLREDKVEVKRQLREMEEREAGLSKRIKRLHVEGHEDPDEDEALTHFQTHLFGLVKEFAASSAQLDHEKRDIALEEGVDAFIMAYIEGWEAFYSEKAESEAQHHQQGSSSGVGSSSTQVDQSHMQQHVLMNPGLSMSMPSMQGIHDHLGDHHLSGPNGISHNDLVVDLDDHGHHHQLTQDTNLDQSQLSAVEALSVTDRMSLALAHSQELDSMFQHAMKLDRKLRERMLKALSSTQTGGPKSLKKTSRRPARPRRRKLPAKKRALNHPQMQQHSQSMQSMHQQLHQHPMHHQQHSQSMQYSNQQSHQQHQMMQQQRRGVL